MDDQNNLMRQLLNQINLAQNLDLGQQGEERRMDERADRQFDGNQVGRAGVSRQGDAQQCDQLADMSQASASHTQSRRSLPSRLNLRTNINLTAIVVRIVKKGAPLLALEEPILVAKLLKIPRKRSPPTRRLGSAIEKEVNQHRPNRECHQHDQPAICAKDIEKLVNNRLRDLKIEGNFEDALRMEVDRANSSPFTAEIDQAAPPKRVSTPSFTRFKGDSNPESHLKHFKSLMILHKTEDALMCKVFAMTLQGAAQDWFHTLPSGSISSFKELAYVFTKEYISYRTIKKNPDHLFNLHKKSDESIRDYIKRFKADRANIVGCDDQIWSSAFKKGLATECELYRELTISPRQTLVEVFATAERYALWDDDRIAEKKADQAAEQASKENGKRRSQPQEFAPAAESYT
ncbi:unnamed protein product, partial [Prunus brigantina]